MVKHTTSMICLGLVALCSCRRVDERHRRPPFAADAPASGVTIRADASPVRAPDVAVVATDPLDADATDLGSMLDVRLVRQLQGMNGTTRLFDLLLVITERGGGTRTLVVPIRGQGFGEDGASSPEDVAVGTVIDVPPQTPLAPWAAERESLGVRIPVHAALLYRVMFHVPGADDHVAVVHDGDQIKVFYFWEDESDRAAAWELNAAVRLSPRAQLDVR